LSYASAATVVSALAAAIIPIILNSFVSQISNAVHINVDVIPNMNNDGRRALIQVTNTGASFAKNLTLIIQTPKKINNVTNLFSTATLTLPVLTSQLYKCIHQRQLINRIWRSLQESSVQVMVH
jgi:hypothetical protein